MKITLTRRQIKFIHAAASQDSIHPQLQLSQIMSHQGHLWIASTDRHRVHVLRICEYKGPEVKAHINTRRILMELEFHGGGAIEINLSGKPDGKDFHAVLHGRVDPKDPLASITNESDILGFATSIIGEIPKGRIPWPDVVRVTPKVDGTTTRVFGGKPLNASYLSDLALGVKLTGDDRIYSWSLKGDMAPAVFANRFGRDPWGGSLPWFVVIMPMSDEQGALAEMVFEDVANLEAQEGTQAA